MFFLFFFVPPFRSVWYYDCCLYNFAVNPLHLCLEFCERFAVDSPPPPFPSTLPLPTEFITFERFKTIKILFQRNSREPRTAVLLTSFCVIGLVSGLPALLEGVLRRPDEPNPKSQCVCVLVYVYILFIFEGVMKQFSPDARFSRC